MKYLLIALLFLLPRPALAVADLQILQTDIRFSKDPLIAGDVVRIYATVHNNGDEDVSGFVTFYQGATLIATSQVISLLAGGSPEEVYVDFVIPTGTFNVQAQVEGTEPVDEVPDNNVTITPTMKPIMDDDRDGIPNEADNCPTVGNGEQSDVDGDGEGDVCDGDDDNDGVTDDVELEVGTDPTVTDSDADGTDDQEDAFPLDEEKQELQVEAEPPAKEQIVLREIITRVAQSIQEEQVTVEAQPEVSDLSFSSNLIFSYERKRWNTFSFKLLGTVEEGFVYTWDFGDGVQSSKGEVTHAYRSPGAYTVTLSGTQPDGITLTESTTVFVPFFSLRNPVVATGVAVLGLILAAAVAVLVAASKKRPL